MHYLCQPHKTCDFIEKWHVSNFCLTSESSERSYVVIFLPSPFQHSVRIGALIQILMNCKFLISTFPKGLFESERQNQAPGYTPYSCLSDLSIKRSAGPRVVFWTAHTLSARIVTIQCPMVTVSFLNSICSSKSAAMLEFFRALAIWLYSTIRAHRWMLAILFVPANISRWQRLWIAKTAKPRHF